MQDKYFNILYIAINIRPVKKKKLKFEEFETKQ